MSERNYEYPVYGSFPPGFTFTDYLTNTPAVTGTIMRNLLGFQVALPCTLLQYDQRTKTATVEAADGVQVTVMNIDPPVSTFNVIFVGKVIGSATLQAEEHQALPDDHDFDKGARLMEHLARPKTWGIERGSESDSENGDGNRNGGSSASRRGGGGASGRGSDRGRGRGGSRTRGRGHGRSSRGS